MALEDSVEVLVEVVDITPEETLSLVFWKFLGMDQGVGNRKVLQATVIAARGTTKNLDIKPALPRDSSVYGIWEIRVELHAIQFAGGLVDSTYEECAMLMLVQIDKETVCCHLLRSKPTSNTSSQHDKCALYTAPSANGLPTATIVCTEANDVWTLLVLWNVGRTS